MKNIFSKITETVHNTLSSLFLIFIAVIVAGIGIGLTILILTKYINTDTPELKKIECFIGIQRGDCPDDLAKIKESELKAEAALQKVADAKAELADIQRRSAEDKRLLANLAKIKNNVGSVTLFKNIDIPQSNFRVTIGTIYKDLLSISRPEYFCYIGLNFNDGFDRNLYIRNLSKDISPKPSALSEANITSSQLAFAKSKCKPYLIHGGA